MQSTKLVNRPVVLGAAVLSLGCLVSACGGGNSSVSSSSSSSVNSSTSSGSSSSTTSSSSSSLVGLDARPSNTSCLAWARPTGNDSISLERVFAGLSFDSPVAMLQAPGDSSRWFVVQQGGVVRKFDNVANPVAGNFIDIDARVDSTGSEMGLLGMAFHPGFPTTDSRVFLSYTATVSGQIVSRVSAFTTPDTGQTLDPNSERILLIVNQPQSNHNGGNIVFGKDGYLYIGLGDGGGGGDNHGTIGNGQNLNTMLGKMLRIDVGNSTATNYNIPAGNPFLGNTKCTASGGSAPCPEIYAWGFRNPWRWSFDKATGELWVGDVGQNVYEEIDHVELGGNYGWRCREGAHAFNTSGCTSGYIDPVTEYDHNLGSAVTGGYVYRGTQTTNLLGRYLFGDFGSGRIWAWLPEQAGGTRTPTQLLLSGRNISSFGEANDGELYVVDYSGGLYHINFTVGSSGGVVPSNLADTGCVSSTNPMQAAASLIPYEINAAFWSDGAVKERWLALPNGQNIVVDSNGVWTFPNGSVLMKSFRVNGALIETRLLMRHSDSTWSGYTYEWNDAQTAATRVQGGKTRALGNGQVWIYPSESQCLECHTNAAGRSLGLMTAQLNRSYLYASTGRTANQLDTLSAINILSPTVSGATATVLTNPNDTAASVSNRARAYLQTNCAQCHQPGGPTPSNMDLRYGTAFVNTNTCNVLPTAGDLGLSGARLIAPGNATSSVLIERTQRRDAHGMPPLGSNVVDSNGVSLLTAWVNSLSGC